MRWPIFLLLACGLLGACTTHVPRDRLPPPLTSETSPDPVRVATIPLPVFATSPNEGDTFGGLVAFLLHDVRDEVNTLVAGQLNYNENFGLTGSLYGAFFPRPERNWDVYLSKSSEVNENYDFRISDRTLLAGRLHIDAFVFRFADGSARFFGFGSEALEGPESNFADRRIGARLSLGYEIVPHLQIVFSQRLEEVDIRQGAVGALPFIRDAFSPAEAPGIEGYTAHAQGLALVYSTLDSPEMPTRGVFARAGFEMSLEALGSSADYLRTMVELKGYLPLANDRFISVGRFAFSHVPGDDVPFLERSILGGETTLRGFGRNRFIDSSSLLLNLEQRLRLFRWEVFNVLADWEIAPFVDIGAVTGSPGDLTWNHFEVNPGIGFRAVVRPNIVGRVDIGFGRDGEAVFVGLNYPF